MIPRERVSPGAYRTLVEYLRHEIPLALGERRPLEEQWSKSLRLYRAKPMEAVKKFPFYGASNLVIPLGAIDTDTIYSRLMGVLWGPERLWSMSALREDAVDYAPRLQEFMKWAQHAELRAYPAIADWLLELTKLGTGVLKERYRREQRLVYEFREQPGGAPLERFARIRVLDNPVMEHVSLYDFLVPSETIDHQTAAWCAERVLLTPQQLEQRARAGVYAGVERLMGRMHDRGSWIADQQFAAQGVSAGMPRRSELWETWLDFDISGIGEPQALVCTIHLPSATVVRLDYNPFFHQERPFDVARYLRQEKQFYGIGVMEMLEMFQTEVTAQHNQRIDAGTISNAPMMKFLRGSGIKEEEPVVIGRWIPVNSMSDIEPVNFGRLPNSSIQDEQMTASYGTRRTGVNDYVMGNNSPSVGYAAAQTNIMQHTEAAKRFDQSLREIRVALSSAGRRCVELYQQFDQGGKVFTVMGPRDGQIVQQIMQFPLELIRNSVSIEVTATSAHLNKEVQIRTNMILMQLVTQFYEQMFQGMMMATNPQLPPPLRALAQQMIVSGSVMMKRVLDSHDMQDVDAIIPDMRELIYGQSQQLEQLGGPPAGVWPFGPQAAGVGPGAGVAGGAAAPLQLAGMGPGI